MSLTLIAQPDSSIDRIDRALWMTPPFSLRCLAGIAVIKLTLAERSPDLTLALRSPSLTLDDRTSSLTLPRRDC